MNSRRLIRSITTLLTAGRIVCLRSRRPSDRGGGCQVHFLPSRSIKILNAERRPYGLLFVGTRCQGAHLVDVFRIMSSIAIRIRPNARGCESPHKIASTFQRIVQSVLEPPNLLPGRDIKKILVTRVPSTTRSSFELIDLLISSSPFARARKLLDTFNQNTPIPGAVENHNLTMLWKLLPEPLQIMLPSVVRGGCGNRMNLKTPRIQSPSKPPNNAALSGSVPSFEHDNCPLSRPQKACWIA